VQALWGEEALLGRFRRIINFEREHVIIGGCFGDFFASVSKTCFVKLGCKLNKRQLLVVGQAQEYYYQKKKKNMHVTKLQT
jgi:hypothetical protein